MKTNFVTRLKSENHRGVGGGGLSLALKCATHLCLPTSNMDPKWCIAPCFICTTKWCQTCQNNLKWCVLTIMVLRRITAVLIHALTFCHLVPLKCDETWRNTIYKRCHMSENTPFDAFFEPGCVGSHNNNNNNSNRYLYSAYKSCGQWPPPSENDDGCTIF